MKMCIKMFVVCLFLACASLIVIRLPSVQGEHIKMGLIVPTGPEFEQSFAWETGASATTIALEKVEADPTLLNGHTFSVVWVMANCNPRIGTGMTVDLRYEEHVDMFIGAPCSLVAVPAGRLASYWNLPFVAWVSRDPTLADKSIFTTMARVMGPLNKVGKAAVEIFKQYSWTLAAIVASDNRDVCGFAAKALLTSFRENNITVGEHVTLDDTHNLQGQLETTMLRIKQRARIVIICNKNLLEERQFMLAAYDHGMVDGDYVFFSLNRLFSDIFETDKPWEGMDGRNVDAYTAYETVLAITVKTVSNEEIDTFRNLIPVKMAEPPFNHTLPPGSKGNLYSPWLHDAVILYAIALNKSLSEGNSLTDGEAWFENVKGLTFEGMSGSVVMDENGDREPEYLIFDLRPSGFMEICADITNIGSGRIFNSILQPIWAKGGLLTPPSDRPACGFLQSCRNSDVYIILVCVCSFAAVALVAGSVAIYLQCRRIKDKREGDGLVWLIAPAELKPFRRRDDEDYKSTFSFFSTKTSSTASDVPVPVRQELIWCRGILCIAKRLVTAHGSLPKDDKDTLKLMLRLDHDNLNRFIGVCLSPEKSILISEYCGKGCLADVLENEEINLDWLFKSSFIFDLIEGMEYIHQSELVSHGNLKSTNCVIDKKWVLKVTGYGIRNSPSTVQPPVTGGFGSQAQDHEIWTKQLWTAPELLRHPDRSLRGTASGDVYSLGIILQEIIQRKGVFPLANEGTLPKDIVSRVRNGETPPFRPLVLPTLCEPQWFILIQSCLNENPNVRPTIREVKKKCIKINNGEKPKVLENIVAKMERYNDNLEGLVEEKTQQFFHEKKKTDLLLYRMLPPLVADKLRKGLEVDPENYDEATIFFSDICDFDEIASGSSPVQVIDLLNDVYTCFDEIIKQHDVYKVETVNDAYLVASGLPKRNGSKHAMEIADMSLNMMEATSTFKIKHWPGRKVELRIGIHSGSCAAGVIGVAMPRYCIFGDTVNVASRMRSHGEACKIHCSESAYTILSKSNGYVFHPRGDVEIKGKGQMRTYWLLQEKQTVGNERTDLTADLTVVA